MTPFRRVASLALLFLLALDVGGASAQLDERLELLEPEVELLYSGDPISLQECIKLALLGSTSLGRLEEDVRNAETDELAALGAFLPNLSLSASWQRQERTDKDQNITEPQLFPIAFQDSLGNPLPLIVGGEPAYQSFQVPTGETQDQTILQTFKSQSLSSNWTVFNGFQRFAERNRASAVRAASEASLDYQETLVRESVTNAYFDLLGAQERVTVALEAEELARQELERSQTYFELGISTRSDVLQAKVRHQQTKLDIVRERNGERNAFAALTHAMGLPQAHRFTIENALVGVEEIEVPDLDGLVETARQQRLDLAATRYNLDASQSAVTTARAGYWPSIEIFGRYSRSVSETPFRFGAQENTSVSWGIQGNWNIFDRFQTKSNSRRAVANRRKAEYDLRQARLDLELEIVQLRNNLIEALESYDVSSVTVEQSQEDLRLAEERFRVGAGTSLDVITAQVNLAQARRDEVDAQVNILKFRNQLVRAAGGDW